jgi:hypothetical protein
MPSLQPLSRASGLLGGTRLLRCLLCLLALVLLLQGSAALFAATLGPRHSHAEQLPHAPLLDLRRGVVMTALPLAQPGRADASVHRQMHRHHHAAAAPGVEFDSAAQQVDAQSTAAALLAIWFPAAAPPLSWSPMAALRDAPQAVPGWFVASAETPTPERPPRAPRRV